MHFLQIRAVPMALFMIDMLFVLSTTVATSHEATEPLKKGQYDWITEFLINWNLHSYMWLVAPALDSIALGNI